MPCRMVRQNHRHNRILARIISEMRHHIQTGVRFPRQRLSALQFVFTIHRACIHREREVMRSLPFQRSRSARNPSVINRSHIIVISKSLRQREERIKVETSKARELSHQVLGAVAKAKLERRSRFQTTGQIAIVKVMLPVCTVSSIAKESPVSRVCFRQITFHIERSRRQSLVVRSIRHSSHRKHVFRIIILPVKSHCTRQNARLVIATFFTTRNRETAFNHVVFIENSATQVRTKDVCIKSLIRTSTERRMRLAVTVNKSSCRFIGKLARTESRRITQRIAQALADKPRMEARAKLRSVFSTKHQILLATLDNINRIDGTISRRCILTDLVFIRAVQRSQSPSLISERIGTVQLSINIKCRKIKRIRRLHLAVARAIVITLAEFRKELFAQIFEHLAIQAAESKAEAIPDKKRCIKHNFLECKTGRASQPPFATRLFRNVLD